MTTPVYDFEAIKRILPHRHPFIFLDRVVTDSAGEVVGQKNVTHCEYLAVDPGSRNKVFPPLFIIEAMGQAAIVLYDRRTPSSPGKERQYLFAGLDEVEFFLPVMPGDQLQFHITFDKIVTNGTIISAFATVQGRKVAQAVMSVSIREK